MVKPRQLLSSLIICSTLFIGCALAQTTLTQIRDTVYNANGTPFNGTVVITWNGYASGGTVSPLSTSARIYNGALSVLLVPSTTAAAGTYYQAVYNSNDGTVTWSEIWQVPPSSTPLTLSQVRQSTTQGSGGSGSGSGGSSGSGGTQYATLPISISQVTNLATDLNTINNTVSALTTQLNNLQSTVNSSGSLASLTTTVNQLSSTVAGLNNSVSALSATVSTLTTSSLAAFSDAETPSGAVNGTNTTFTLANTPATSASVAIYRNGVLQSNGTDFTISGRTVTFASVSMPQSGDIIQAFYRLPITGSPATFVDNEVPGGTIDGNNVNFTLANSPNPALSLKLYKNGILLAPSVDYTLSGSAITFLNANITPKSGDSILASYRH
jgi:uncharacterized protein YoxC